jgi:penicillin-insensitive murein endopeptidase
MAEPHISRLGNVQEDAASRKARCQEPAVALQLPLPHLETTEIADHVKNEPDALGSASVGLPTRGRLWGGVRLASSEHVEAVTQPYAWGTAAAVTSIERAARIVRCRFDDSPKLHVGSLSRKNGGPLYPHRSHQSGLDADVGYFYSDGSVWYQYATAKNLDVERTWALIEAFHAGGNVEYLFIDRRVQALVREHAEAVSPELITVLFDGTPQKQPLIRHARGHTTHLHVRFDDRAAKRNAKRLLPHIGPRYLFAAYRR